MYIDQSKCVSTNSHIDVSDDICSCVVHLFDSIICSRITKKASNEVQQSVHAINKKRALSILLLLLFTCQYYCVSIYKKYQIADSIAPMMRSLPGQSGFLACYATYKDNMFQTRLWKNQKLCDQFKDCHHHRYVLLKLYST